jgi:hypothetical protein
MTAKNVTVKPVSVTVETPAGHKPPRPGSRAARMTQPLARSVLKELAEQAGVCLHPVVLRRTDTQTGQTEIVEVPCGATLASKCAPCAERGRRLRMQQIREGWHLAEEPTVPADPPTDEQRALVELRAHLEFARADAERSGDWADLAELDEEIGRAEEAIAESGLRGTTAPTDRQPKPRRARSTKRRDDVPDLPRLTVEDRTLGKVYAGRDGSTHRPSMLVTLTLGSYGPVHSAIRRGPYRVPCACGKTHSDHDAQLHTPVDPAGYDYRRAALDAIHFAALIDVFWKNARKAAGWKVQYAGAVELQKRLTPHAHFAMRGTLPRKFLKQVAAATYTSVWWPSFDRPVYSLDRAPEWDEAAGGYVDPKTRAVLPTWDEAIDAINRAPEPTPAYVARLGTLDARGVEGGTKDAERSIRYVTKYVTKDLKEHASPDSDAQRAHFERLHAELSVLPCSPSCANWLLYGVQPKAPVDPKTDRWKHLIPGRCKGKVHQPKTLGFTGRRVLISQQWSNKTLADHRADNRDWVRAVLAEHGENEDQADAADAENGQVDEAERGRFVFQLARPDDPDVMPVQHRLMKAISVRQRWRAALDQARRKAADQVSTVPEQEA